MQTTSVLMRELTHLSDATLAGQHGPGWVHVVQEEGRWLGMQAGAEMRFSMAQPLHAEVEPLDIQRPAWF